MFTYFLIQLLAATVNKWCYYTLSLVLGLVLELGLGLGSGLVWVGLHLKLELCWVTVMVRITVRFRILARVMIWTRLGLASVIFMAWFGWVMVGMGLRL